MDEDLRRRLQAQGVAFFDGFDYRPIATEALAARFELGKRDLPELTEALGALEEAGIAVHVAGRGWCSPRREGWLVGTLGVKRRGFGVVRPARPDPKGDVFIPPNKLGSAHDGDLVLVKPVKPKRRGQEDGRASSELREGRVLAVLRRSRRVLLGVYVAGERETGTVEPLLEENLREIYIPPQRRKGARDGQRVLVRLLEEPTVGGMPSGEVVEIAAPEGTWRADAQWIIAEYELPEHFPAAALAEAERFPDAIPEEEIARRTDLRSEILFTIDPEDAKDFDDAVTLARTAPGGYRLGVFIADVSHYVRAGSELDRAAYERGTSVYLPGKVLPMLPERLSNHLCSLAPEVERLVQAIWMEIDPSGALTAWRQEAAVIRSTARLTYAEAQAILDDEPPPRSKPRPAPAIAAMVRAMDELREKLRARRLEGGALELDLEEQELLLDEAGEVLDVRVRPRDRAHNLIEEFMLLANEAVARIATSRSVGILRREHPAPSEEDVAQFLKLCRALVPGIRVVGERDFRELVERVRGRPIAPVINMALLRTLTRAQYGARKSLHFALAKEEYCHFTSPIRRYPDLQVHRVLFGPGAVAAARAGLGDLANLERMAEHLSAVERRAEEAEREMKKMRAIGWLRRRLGDRFAGVITAVFEYGFFVRLDETMIEGMVHVSTLDDDYYQLHEASFALRGRNKGRTFRVGDAIEVQLRAAEPMARQVDLVYLVHRAARETAGVRKKPRG